MKKFFFALCLVFCCCAVADEAKESASACESAIKLPPNERLLYSVRWGIFSNAATLEFKTSNGSAPNALILLTELNTAGFVRRVHKLTQTIESSFEFAPQWRNLKTKAEKTEGRKTEKYEAKFDYPKQEFYLTDFIDPQKSKSAEMPYQCVSDIATGIFRMRTVNFENNGPVYIPIFSDDEIYEVAVYARGVETITTPYGAFEALKIEPRMDENPRGIFRKAKEIFLWVSQDERRLLLRIFLKLKIASADVCLAEYETEQ